MSEELISREALQEKFNAECEGECRYCKHCKHMKGEFDGCALIDDAPAVDAEPVRHGRWKLETKRLASCSGCGMLRDIETQIAWEYCPNCGAKMDLEATND